MSKQMVLQSFDDLDGSFATDMVSLGLDGTWVDLDLTAEHAAELRQLVDKYMRAGKQVEEPAVVSSFHPGQAMESRRFAYNARAYARSIGMEVSDNGPLPRAAREAYQTLLNSQKTESPAA